MSFSALSFAAPHWLWGLLLIPALTALFFWAERQAARKLAQLMRSPRLRAQLTGAASAGRRRWRFGLMLLGLAGLLVAMAMPRWGYENQPVRRKGLDLLLIVDVSKSMLAKDLTPNRLARAKLAAQDLIGQLQGDRVGLVAFAGTAFLQAPLTIDYDAALTALGDLDTETIPRGGTNLESAIDLAITAFGKAEADNRAIVFFTDGEATEGEGANGLEAAARAAEAGIKIFTVGVGTSEGAFIPLPGSNGEFVRDRDGRVVRSKLDETTLDKIAKAANGFYVSAQNGQNAMKTLAQNGLQKVKTGDIDARQSRRPIERYQWPLGAALACLGLAALIGERRKARVLAPGMAGPRAVPMARRTTATPTAAAVSALALAGLLSALPTLRGAATAEDPMKLYNAGQYAKAYEAFKQLAQKSPDAAKLQFDAGASAYMDGKYEDALNAFGQAMTADNAGLQAMSHYNFGNSLFRRGEKQKDRETKIQDWKNAIEHYDNTLNLLRTNRNEPLAKDTAYNRDLVQRLLDEELKPKPTPPPQQKQDQQKQDQQKQDQQKQGSQSQGQQPQPNQQKNQQDSDTNQNGSSQSQDKPGESNQPPQQDPAGQPKDQKKDENSPPQGGKPGAPQDKPPQPGKEQNSDKDPQPGKEPASADNKPDPASAPNQDQPRQRGEFQSKPGEPPKDKGDQTAQELNDQNQPVEKGKMTPAQARALLDALKGEDDKVDLNDRKDRRFEPDINDW